jgi:GxxExxY protein
VTVIGDHLTMNANAITREVIGAAMRVHTALGPGLLESAYRACLCRELELRGLRVQTEVAVPVVYRGLTIPTAYRMDLLVEDVVIVETKALSRMTENHEAQLLSHLRLSARTVGLLINFHVRHLRDGIKRMVNNYKGPRLEDPQ